MMTSRKMVAFVVAWFLIVVVTALSVLAQIERPSPPLKMKGYEDIYIRDAKRGVCIRLMLEVGLPPNTLEAWIVPDQECRR